MKNSTDCGEERIRLSHPYIDQLKEIEQATGRIITSEESLLQNILGYVEYYTGNKRDLESFIKIIRYAMNEIINGLYTAQDRDSLFEHLRELEFWTLTIHFRRFSSLFPWGLSSEYKMKQNYGRIPMILVPLEQYREMQYNQLLLKETKKKYVIHKKQQELNQYKKIEEGEYFVLINEDPETGEFWGECPELPGCACGGRTIDELMANMRRLARETLEEWGTKEIDPVQEIRRLVIK